MEFSGNTLSAKKTEKPMQKGDYLAMEGTFLFPVDFDPKKGLVSEIVRNKIISILELKFETFSKKYVAIEKEKLVALNKKLFGKEGEIRKQKVIDQITDFELSGNTRIFIRKELVIKFDWFQKRTNQKIAQIIPIKSSRAA